MTETFTMSIDDNKIGVRLVYKSSSIIHNDIIKNP